MKSSIVLFAAPLLAACTTIAGAAPPLVPSQWTFTTIDGQAPVRGGTRLELRDGSIGANAGCNRLGGNLKIEGNRLRIGPIMSTQMFCDGAMDQERAVSELLQASPRFVYQGDRLTLTGGKHRAVLERLR